MKQQSKLILATILAGSIGLAGLGISHAQTTNQTTAATVSDTVDQPVSTTASMAAAHPPVDPTLGGHVGANGVKEELLTGDAATKATAAALAAAPGSTIERVETDAEGATYEAHIIKADGTHATVKMDGSFTVTSTEAGPR